MWNGTGRGQEAQQRTDSISWPFTILGAKALGRDSSTELSKDMGVSGVPTVALEGRSPRSFRLHQNCLQHRQNSGLSGRYAGQGSLCTCTKSTFLGPLKDSLPMGIATPTSGSVLCSSEGWLATLGCAGFLFVFFQKRELYSSALDSCTLSRLRDLKEGLLWYTLHFKVG